MKLLRRHLEDAGLKARLTELSLSSQARVPTNIPWQVVGHLSTSAAYRFDPCLGNPL